MKEIREKLYIGNVFDLKTILSTSDHAFTHVLSLLSMDILLNYCPTLQNSRFDKGGSCLNKSLGNDDLNLLDQVAACRPPSKIHKDITVFYSKVRGRDLSITMMAVPWKDMSSQNILDDLEQCLDFIENGLQTGVVFVHCFAGVSRSASVVTAYLMRTERIPFTDALDSLKRLHESASPNDGFVDQLKLFEKMSFSIDHGHPEYKKFRVEKLRQAYEEGESVDFHTFEADPACSSSCIYDKDYKGECLSIHGDLKSLPQIYRCKKCRRIVASEANIIVHEPQKIQASFKGKKRSQLPLFNEVHVPECTSLFVEPMQWMTSVQGGEVLGKLSCSNCEARLGSFNWSGMQCSCGNWVVPAFQLHKSRMDSM